MREPFTLMLPRAITVTSLGSVVKMPRALASLTLKVREPTFPRRRRDVDVAAVQRGDLGGKHVEIAGKHDVDVRAVSEELGEGGVPARSL
jgi:hypothetical protein